MSYLFKSNSVYIKFLCLFLISVFLLFSLTFNSPQTSPLTNASHTSTGKSSLSKLSSLTSSNPITITSDANFASQALANSWPGDGSSANPYIIQNLQIINNTNNSKGISISGVTKYFIIRNNYIEMTGYSAYGIYLSQTSNVGVIDNNTLFNNTADGVYLYNSHNTTVSNNYFNYNKGDGLQPFFTNQTKILSNTFTNNGNAIYLRFSSFNTVFNNSISHNSYGIFHQGGNIFNTYLNNTFKDNLYQILVQASPPTSPYDYNNISYNTFVNGSTNGIYFSGPVSNIIIANNNFTNNYEGLRFAGEALNCSIYGNFFVDNIYGIWSSVGDSNVYNNSFIGNQYGINNINSQKGVYKDNLLINNYYGIVISSSHNGTYLNNTVMNSNYAIQISGGKNNTLIDNNVINNTYGIWFFSDANNTFYGNNFLHNSVQITGGVASDKADNGTFGNFWLNLMSSAVDSNANGIIDTPYSVGSITDRFPLMIWNNESLPLEIVNANNDVSYNEGNPAFNITWRAIDESPAQYIIYQNGTPFKTNSWTSFETVYATLGGLMLGSYNYTIVFSDTDGNIKTDTVIVTVHDVTPPTIIGSSTYVYMEDTSGHSLTWNVTDNHPAKYYILKNGVNVQNGTWVSNSNITILIDGLLKNTYTYKLYVNDTSNNIQSFTTTVIVYDGTPPNVTDYGNETVEGGSSGQTVNWNATDRYPAYYELYRDGVLIANNSWSSGINISDLIDTSTLGYYNYSIIVFDQSGNNMTDMVYILVVDTTNPVMLTYPLTNISFYSGIIGNNLSWTAYDLYPASYSILLNGSVYQNGLWTNNQISTNIDTLPIGFYNLTMVFTDTSGNNGSKTLWITVARDDIAPVIINQPTNITYQNITSNNVVSWKATDNVKTGNYSLYIDSNLITTLTWINNTLLTINVDGLPVGVHNVTIIFRDAENNMVISTVWVTVFADTTSPTILSPPTNTSYLLGQTGYSASWTAIDDINSANYTIYKNGASLGTITWNNNTVVSVQLDGLSVGVYNYTIIFRDTSGNSATNTIWVTVFADTQAPILLVVPSNISYTYGNTGNFASWTAIDDYYPANYSLYKDGSLLTTNSWTNNTAVNINVDGLFPGLFNYTVIFNDTFGNSVSSTVWVTVTGIIIDTNAPVIISSPSNITYQDISISNSVSWIAIDDIAPNNYTYYVNGLITSEGSWFNATALSINIDGYSAGSYNLTIVFRDLNGNNVTDTIWLTVYHDSVAPLIVSSPMNGSYELGTSGNTVSWTSQENIQPANYSLYIDSSFISSNSWQNNTELTINIDGLNVGVHKIEISFKDTTGNTANDTIYITVWQDVTPPTIVEQPNNMQYTVGQTSNIANWIVTDDNAPGNYTLLSNGMLFQNGNWFNDTQVSISLDGFNVGTYNLTIIFRDQNGNEVIFSFWLEVDDVQTLTSLPPKTSETQPVSSSASIISKTTPSSNSHSASNNSDSNTTITTQLPSMSVFVLLFSMFVLIFVRRRKV